MSTELQSTATPCAGTDRVSLWALGNGRYIGIDIGSEDRTIECEVHVHADGSIEVIDIREYPPRRENNAAD